MIGGTAWDFANPGRVPPGSLDLLVIDEAGQFCLANTIAVAASAANLLLLGDPQQLPQVSQGTHPEPVDGSALGWLVEDHRTLPAERGYFLDLSRRMHPAVCAPVSALSYEGRLQPYTEVTAARRLDGYPPGLQVLRVHHEGNATESPEEAEAIVDLIHSLVGLDWTAEGGTRPLTSNDVLVLAPYNAQVVLLRRHLADAGLGDVRVGTVDKFQGAEAPVAIVSMTASSVERHTARNPVPAQPESAECGDQPRAVCGCDRPCGRADRVPAGRADRSGGTRRVPGVDGAGRADLAL